MKLKTKIYPKNTDIYIMYSDNQKTVEWEDNSSASNTKVYLM